MPLVKVVRRLRVLEYVGTEEFVNNCIEQSTVKGTFKPVTHKPNSITSAWLGETNEVIQRDYYLLDEEPKVG